MNSNKWWVLLGIGLGFVLVLVFGLATLGTALLGANQAAESTELATTAAACRVVAIPGVLRDVTCNWYSHCVGYIRSSGGSSATWFVFHGWNLQDYQTVTKLVFLCGM